MQLFPYCTKLPYWYYLFVDTVTITILYNCAVKIQMHFCNTSKNKLTTCLNKLPSLNAFDRTILLLQLQEMCKIWNLCKNAQVSYFVHFMWLYLHFQSKPLMNLKIFANVHKWHKFDWQLPSSHARAKRFENWIHSPEVTLVLWLTGSHTWAACAKQASCFLYWLSVFTLAVPFFRFTLQKIQLHIKYKTVLFPKL